MKKFIVSCLLVFLYISAAFSENLRVTFIDVNQGDSIFIQTPGGKNILIDAGGIIEMPDKRVYNAGLNSVLPFLKKENVKKLDYIVFSHSHPDHAGGMLNVLAAIPVGSAYGTGYYGQDDKEYIKCLDIIEQKQIRFNKVFAGDQLDWDSSIKVEVMAPNKGLVFEKQNNNSMIFKITFDKISFLFTGDAELEEEQQAADIYGYKLKADVMKAPHHGSYSSSSMVFMNYVKPVYAVISCGMINSFGHPNSSVLARYKKMGIKVLRTDYDGSITFITDGQTLKVETAERK